MLFAVSAAQNQEPSPTATSSGSSSSSSSSSQLNSILAPNEFLSLLVDSLKYQDPLNPTNSAEFLSQLAQLSQVETLQQLSQTDGSAGQASQLASGASLIGHTVSGLDAKGDSISGTVTAVTDGSAGPVLVLATSGELPLSSVTKVS